MSKIYIYFLLFVVAGIGRPAFSQYRLIVRPADHGISKADKAGDELNELGLTTDFRNAFACAAYVNKLPSLLLARGFPVASIDSVRYEEDTAFAWIFRGPAYKLAAVRTDSVEKKLLAQSGWNELVLPGKPLSLSRLEEGQRKIFSYLEDSGYPFAKVGLDSLRFEGDKFYAMLKVDKGPLYQIDSIRIYGNADISHAFLQRYLGILNGSLYRRSRLQNITARLRELPYLKEAQPWDLTLLGTGSVVNLYLAPRKSSEINALLGFGPSGGETGTGKMQLTGEATIRLRNALGNGELIGVNWQQLQVKSPRLDLAFEQPYLWGSPIGITSSFNLFKKDSSYLNLDVLLGAQYSLSGHETGKLFVQQQSTHLLDIDTILIKNTRKLPDERDVSTVSLGVEYQWNKTDYRYNPRKGTVLHLVAAAGRRSIRKNNVILKLSSPDFSYDQLYEDEQPRTYQFRAKIGGDWYIPLGRSSTLKLALNAALLHSNEIFRNELFQIGGYKLLRGFDEESIYASRYAVSTVEYRYLMGLNSYLFGFADIGLTANASAKQQLRNNYAGAGLGMALETKAGQFTISYAAGKRNDLKFDIRQSKIHIGYINYF